MLRVRCHACVGSPQKHSPAWDKHSVYCDVSAVPELLFGYQMVADFFFCQRSEEATVSRPACLHSHGGDSLVTEEETPGTHTYTRAGLGEETPLHTCTRGRDSARPPPPPPPPQFH